MIEKLFEHYKLTGLSCLGLVLFLAVFTGWLLWVYRRGSSEIYSRLERMPLDDQASNSSGESGLCQ